jgi:hypothetical protein
MGSFGAHGLIPRAAETKSPWSARSRAPAATPQHARAPSLPRRFVFARKRSRSIPWRKVFSGVFVISSRCSPCYRVVFTFGVLRGRSLEAPPVAVGEKGEA